MKTLIVNISDIHYSVNGTPENQGKVLSAFVEDLKKQVSQYEHDECYLLIGGDLVQEADDKANYSSFDEHIIKEIVKGISLNRQNIIAVAGNHDVQRNVVMSNYEVHHKLVLSNIEEKGLNDLLDDAEKNKLLVGKFANFQSYVEIMLQKKLDNPFSYGYDINEDWSIYCINTALLSEGGLNGWNDLGHLAVETRRLTTWLGEHKNRKKILLMHHPASFCTDWVQSELKEMIRNNFDVVFSGHMHSQDILCDNQKETKTIFASSPQLFTDKCDMTLGYCIFVIDGIEPDRLVYRQWVKERGCFKSGISFTDDDVYPGIVMFKSPMEKISEEDYVLRYYDSKLNKEMHVFANQPNLWIERHLCKERLDKGVHNFRNITMYSESDIINNPQNLYVVSTPVSGLTCFAYHFLKGLRAQHGALGVYIQCTGRTLESFKSALETSMIELRIKSGETIDWLVLDEWYEDSMLARQVLTFMYQQYPNAHFMLLTYSRERIEGENENEKELFESFETRYLAPINRTQMRTIVDAYNSKNYMGENDKVLKRLDDDLRSFNMHRSPFNCITLMEVFNSNKFEEYPINRTLVIEKALRKIFEITDFPNYASEFPNLTDCEYAVGLFCARVLEEDIFSNGSVFIFDKEGFVSAIKDKLSDQGVTLNTDLLFDVLVRSGLFVPYGYKYTFRFRTWMYYFAAVYMTYDPKFTAFILSNKRYINYPEIIEFYTGKTQRQDDALKVLTTDLFAVVQSVQRKFKVEPEFNPFANIRLKSDEESKQAIINSINDKIKQSELPSDVKDILLDETYNISTPYNQQVYQKVVEDTVQNMFRDIEISSKALRNTVYVPKVIKLNLLESVLDAWATFAKVISLFSKQFAQQGWIYIDGVGFQLVEAYQNYGEQDKIIQIITSIPNNIMQLFNDDIYSARLSDILVESFEREEDKVKKHLLAYLLILNNPIRWDDCVEKYIRNQQKDSYYLMDVCGALGYRKDWVTPEDQRQKNDIKRLLQTVTYKLQHNGHMPKSIGDLKPKTIEMADIPQMPFVGKKKRWQKRRK